MSDSKVKYTTVKEVSVEKLIDSAKGHAAGQRKMRNNEGNAWAQTVLWLNALMPLEDYDESQELKDIAEDVRDTFKANFLTERDEALGELDSESEGRNARTGKMVTILKDGEPIWSSWEETKLPIAYCGDIARVIKAGVVDQVIPKPNRVMARNDALKLAKTPEEALETIKRSVKLAEDKFKVLSDDDKLKALNIVNDLYELMDADTKSVEPVAKAA